MSKKKNNSSSPADAGAMPTKQKLSKLFWIISPAFTRWAESHMHEKGLTPQRVRLMIPLKENGPMIMSALRDELGVSSSAITALVDALEKDGMVIRESHSGDRRATMIAITAKGEKIMTENCGMFRERVAELFSGFSAAKQEQLLDMLLEVRQALIGRHMLEDCDLFHCATEEHKS